jgi:MFS family permease
VIAVLSLGWGFASAHFNLAHAQLMMNTMPEMGRNHFFAFFSVILSLGLGLAPLLWGLILDALGPFRVAVGSAEINRYTCYFAALAGLCLVGALYGKRLEENSPLAAPETNLKAAAIHAGLRRLGRLWYR